MPVTDTMVSAICTNGHRISLWGNPVKAQPGERVKFWGGDLRCGECNAPVYGGGKPS
jgi:hypothetical protein